MNNLSDLSGEINKCKRCKLYLTANNVVVGDGNEKADIMFVGEAPGRAEDASGKPFVGRAGKVLDELLSSVDLHRNDVFITNIVKHRPPNNRDPKTDEIESCKYFFESEIDIVNPKLIVTLGSYSLRNFFPLLNISDVHGVLQNVLIKERMFHLFPLYHPASALYNPRLLNILFDDFKKIPIILSETFNN